MMSWEHRQSSASLASVYLVSEAKASAKALNLIRISPFFMFFFFLVWGFNQGKWQQIEDWSSEQPLSSSICYPHIPRTLFSSFTSSVESWEDDVFPGETSDSFYSCLTSNAADDSTLRHCIRKPSTCIRADPFQSVDYIWQARDDVRENKTFFYSQSFLGGSDSCTTTVYVGLKESQTDGEENQFETNTPHQQTVGEVHQIRAEEEMGRDCQQQSEVVHTGLMLADVSSARTENTGKGKRAVSHITRVLSHRTHKCSSSSSRLSCLTGGTHTQISGQLFKSWFTHINMIFHL